MKARVTVSAILLASGSILASAASAQAIEPATEAQPDSGAQPGIDVIIVTAQKRDQAVNDVPLSISLATGETLAQTGVQNVADLPKLVPGLTFTPSLNASPILTLRGVGFNEYTLGASPTVSVYNDQAPVPFLSMARGNTFDLERVEVLKGPQGILFGQNSTGGAINYIVAKPVDRFEAGFDASYGRFDETVVSGFVNVPLGDTLAGRVSVRTLQMSDWQYDYRNPSDTHGSQDFLEGRAQIGWQPSSGVNVLLSASGWRDKSDTPGTQITGFRFQTTASAAAQQRANALLAVPLAPEEARASSWGDFPRERDDNYLQVSLRGDFDMSDSVTFTSLTSVDRYREDYSYDRDGTSLRILDLLESLGSIDDFSQELRLTGVGDRLNWVLGTNIFTAQASSVNTLTVADATNGIILGRPFSIVTQTFDLDIDEFSFFGNADLTLGSIVTLTGGLRYTNSARRYNGCTRGDAGLSAGLTQLSTILSGSPTTPIVPGECVTLLANQKPGEFFDRLEEDNLSWRAGVTVEPSADALLYAEAGFKLTLADRRVQLNGAAFYYDYQDKQVRGNILVPVFQVIERLVNVPSSRIAGAELQLQVAPVTGLTLSASGTYLDTKILEFTGLNDARVSQDFRGQPIPYTPKWQISGDAEYRFYDIGNFEPFVGANFVYNSETNSAISTPAFARIKPFTVIDLRAGVTTADGRWTIAAYGRNVTNEYYWTNAYATQDVIVRNAARPVTYGLRVSARFN